MESLTSEVEKKWKRWTNLVYDNITRIIVEVVVVGNFHFFLLFLVLLVLVKKVYLGEKLINVAHD
jgi:hypothetical protein